MNARIISVLQLAPDSSVKNFVFLTRETEFGQFIDPDITAISAVNAGLTLDDFLFMNSNHPSFDVYWSVNSYAGIDCPARAPADDVAILAKIFASGSNELQQLVSDSMRRLNAGSSVIQNPYYLAPEDEEDEEE